MSERYRGFTLVEALLGLSIVALAVLALYAMIPFAFKGVESNTVEAQAASVGQQYLDEERNAELYDLAMPGPTTVAIDSSDSYVTPTKSPVAFTVTPNGCSKMRHGGVNVTIYACSVAVTWIQGGAARTVTVQTYVTK